MKIVHLIIISIIIGSCSVTKEQSIGQYEMKNNSQTRIIINPDSTFQLYSAEQNPYLHPFEHPDKYFFTTKGFWDVSKNKLIITSDSNAKYGKAIEIIDTTKINHDGTEVVFLDYKNDTIPVLQVAIGDSLIIARMHGVMPYLIYDPTELKSNSNFLKITENVDSLKFTFYGYPPIIYPFERLEGYKYTFRLMPIPKPSYFSRKQMIIRKEKLVDKELNFKFLKSKTADNKK